MLRIIVGSPRSQIVGDLPPETDVLLRAALRFRPNDADQMVRARATKLRQANPNLTADEAWEKSLSQWDGSFALYSRRAFHTGLLARVRHYLPEAEVIWPEANPNPSSHPTLRDYQEEIVATLSASPDWGIVQAPPRSGKTAIAAADMLSQGLYPAVFLIPGAVGITPAKQLREELGRWVGDEVGWIGDGIHEARKITVMTSGSAYEALVRQLVIRPISEIRQGRWGKENATPHHQATANLVAEARYLVVDETHMVLSKRDLSVLDAFRSTLRRRGLSGTAWIESGWGMALEARVGGVIASIPRQQLVDAGYLVPADVTMVKLPQQLYAGDAWQAVYKSYVVENPLRNELIASWCEQQTQAGRTVLVIVSQLRHGHLLHEMIPNSTEAYGDSRGDVRSEILSQMRDRKLPVVISTVMNQAVDVPTLDCVAVACGGRDSGLLTQRVLRAGTAYPGKSCCYVLDFLDRAKVMTKAAKDRLLTYTRTDACVARVVDPEEITGQV